MEKLTAKEMVAILKKYQNNPYVHPLTCGRDSRHNILIPFEENDKVILKCPDCDYVQILSDSLGEHIVKLADYEYPFPESIKKLMEKKLGD